MNTANFRVTSGMKKLIAGYLVIFVLLMGTIVGLQLVDQAGIGDTRRDASTSGIDLSLNPSAATVAPGQTFTVDVIADPKGQSMTAADVTLQVNPAHFTIVSLTKGNMFDQASTPYGPNTTTLLFDQATGQGSVDNTAGTARIAVGATCDRCYLGSATPIPTPNSPTLAPCQTSPAPACYPRTASGQIARLTLTVKAGVSGNSTISFVPANSQTAALGSDADATVDRLTTTINIAAASTCTGDTNGDKKVNATDFSLVVSNFNPLVTCATGATCTGDVNGDRKVNATDFSLVVSNFNPLVTCP